MSAGQVDATGAPRARADAQASHADSQAELAGRPVTFAQWLSTLDDDQLLRLLQARPDVSVPPPPDFEVLARRLASSASVGRTMERVDQFGLEILETLILLGRATSVAETAELAGVDEEALRVGLDRLRRLGLVWGDDAAVHLPRGVADEVGPHPLGLGRAAAVLLRTEVEPEERATLTANLDLSHRTQGALPALVAHFEDAERLAALLGDVGEPERALLEQLADGSPVGSTGNPVAVPELAQAGTAVARLLARGLLLPAGGDLVELPREVALAFRGTGGPGGTGEADPPPRVGGGLPPPAPRAGGPQVGAP